MLKCLLLDLTQRHFIFLFFSFSNKKKKKKSLVLLTAVRITGRMFESGPCYSFDYSIVVFIHNVCYTFRKIAPK